MDLEQITRDKSYQNNLIKESKITEVFVNWCISHNYNYKVYPTNTRENIRGCDIAVYTGEMFMFVDLKGCQNKYDTVCLSYQRSYDGEHWFDTLNNRMTTDYVFIDEFGYMYTIAKEDVISNLNNYKKVYVSPKKAGHYQRTALIPKSELKRLT